MRLIAAALLGVIAAGSTFCRSSVAPSDKRERAYRANNVGIAELERFNYANAAQAFRQALQIDDTLVISRINLSIALLYSQDDQGAVREATEAVRVLPSSPQAHYVLGLAARAQNRASDALREFGRVRETDPTDIGTSVNLGEIYLEQQQYTQAIEALEAAAAAEPFNVTAAYNLGLALTRGGQTVKGDAMLQRARALRTTEYAVTYGTGYLEEGRYAEAIDSSGAEPELVDRAVPRDTFTPIAIAPSDRASVPSPFGHRYSAADLTPAGIVQIAAGMGGGLTLLDVDNDGDMDLVDVSSNGQRLFRNDGHAQWTNVTAASGLGAVPPNAVPVGCVAGDYDNDGLTDLFVLRYGQSSLYHNDGDGHFTDVTSSAGIPSYKFLPGTAALVDVDHDGDLDLVIGGLADLVQSRPRAADHALTFPGDFAPAPLLLLRNNGNGTFTDATSESHLTAATHAVAIVPTDFDNHRDVDLLVVNRRGSPLLFRNLRDGTFVDVAEEVGLTAIIGRDTEVTAVTAADVNKDDFPDFFFARSDGGVFALSDGRGRFRAAAAPASTRAALASQFLDYDNDGLLDLLTWSSGGPRILRNLGASWSDVTASAIAEAAPGTPLLSSPRSLALADLNDDGRTDLVASSAGAIVFWQNGGAGGGRPLRVVLKGRVGNRGGVGSKVQVRAGSLSSRLETSAAVPSIAPADVIFGLGNRPEADAVRVLWPSGILQTEMRPATLAPRLLIEELNRKPSSCPFLFTWNGRQFEFVTDFMGGGEMGYLEKPGEHRRRNIPDPVEYVRIGGDQLTARGGQFDIRVTNELEETLFADRMDLIAIAHPSDTDVYPGAGMTEAPKPFRLFAVGGERVPHAIDDEGRDVTSRIAQIDRRYPDSFALDRFRGFAATHTLTLDLAPVGAAPVLLLTGWTDYAYSSDNLAAYQAGLSLTPPMLQARDAAGSWRTIVADIGIPVGRPQTVTVDLAGRLRPGEHEVRIVTNMRIYWDRVLVGTAAPRQDLEMRSLVTVAATLRSRGFSAEVRPDGQDPPRYDYDRASPASPWKTMSGSYTREGDVRELLTKADDMFVIAKPGDEIALSFDATPLGPLPAGWTRTFLLLADGFSKEMDLNSGSPDRVAPLPFHAMTTYPYPPPQHYPDTPAYRRYEAEYNTRSVVRSVPPLAAVSPP
jgi:hypothetical protein